MNWMPALTDDQMNDDQRKAFERAKTKFGIGEDAEAPAWLRVLANSPEFLKDTYMNVDRNIMSDGKLQAKTKFLLAMTAASHAGHGEVAKYFAEKAIEAGFEEAHVYEAMGISATSTSFNYYYKFRSLVGASEFDGFNVGLRASLFMRPSLGKAFAELVNLMTSTSNGCPSCVAGHAIEATKYDVSREQIDEAIRVNAIVHSICAFLATSNL